MFEEEAVGLGQSRPGGLAMRSGCCWQRTLALGRGQDSGIPRRDGGLGRGPCRAGQTGSRLGHAGCLFEGIARGRGGSRAGKEEVEGEDRQTERVPFGGGADSLAGRQGVGTGMKTA